jgi:hypothetical protein
MLNHQKYDKSAFQELSFIDVVVIVINSHHFVAVMKKFLFSAWDDNG